MSKSALELLVSQLTDFSSVRTLSLSKANFSAESIRKLCHFIQVNPYLRSLDLSWNELSYKDYSPILSCLSENKTLEDINLSHNQLYHFNPN